MEKVNDMGFRFRKKVGPFNLSKSGVSMSIGRRGMTVNTPIITSRPRGTRLTLGLPGSGLSYVTRIKGPRGYTPREGSPGDVVLKVVIWCVIGYFVVKWLAGG
jgi:hypothetical protein